MSGYIGSKASVTVVSPETDSRYVNVAGDTMTGGLTVPSMTSTGAITASGGVYLGGTSAVNLLDDYEEGTWEPYWSDASGNAIFASAPSDKFGYYTKIGDTVTANSYFLMPSSFTATGFYSASGGLCIGGLPFVGKVDASNMNFYAGSTGYFQSLAGLSAGYSPHIYLRLGTNLLQLMYAGGTAGVVFPQSVAYSGNSGIITSVTYKTAS